MPIDWHYHRSGCQTCKKMQAFLDERSITSEEVVSATKVKYPDQQAIEIAETGEHLVIAKGKKIVEFDLKENRPDDEELLKHLTGPTGNLRAPTLRIGKTIFVGFNEDEFASRFDQLGL